MISFHGVRGTSVRIDLARYPGLPRHPRTMYAFKSVFSNPPEEMAKTCALQAAFPRATKHEIHL